MPQKRSKNSVKNSEIVGSNGVLGSTPTAACKCRRKTDAP